jgi:hypothetical protein
MMFPKIVANCISLLPISSPTTFLGRPWMDIGSLAVVVLEDELETSVLLIEQDIYLLPRGPVNAGHRCCLRQPLLVQAS